MMFKSKMHCFNCGLADFYRFAKRSVLVDFDIEQENQSGSYPVDADEDQLLPIRCHNCGLPRLKVLYWGDEVLAKNSEGDDGLKPIPPAS